MSDESCSSLSHTSIYHFLCRPMMLHTIERFQEIERTIDALALDGCWNTKPLMDVSAICCLCVFVAVMSLMLMRIPVSV